MKSLFTNIPTKLIMGPITKETSIKSWQLYFEGWGVNITLGMMEMCINMFGVAVAVYLLTFLASYELCVS